MSKGICIFGGSFDPVHLGHKRLADFVTDKLSLEKMLIIPAAMSPFKSTSGGTAEDRLTMCRLAFPEEKYEVSDIEIKRGGKSYTVDTVRAVKKLFPHSRLCLLIGSDQLLSFNRWYCYKEILSLVTLISVSREDSVKTEKLRDFAEKELSAYGECKILDFDPLEISSTELREAIEKNEDTSLFLEKTVRAYIDEKGLYKNAE